MKHSHVTEINANLFRQSTLEKNKIVDHVTKEMAAKLGIHLLEQKLINIEIIDPSEPIETKRYDEKDLSYILSKRKHLEVENKVQITISINL